MKTPQQEKHLICSVSAPRGGALPRTSASRGCPLALSRPSGGSSPSQLGLLHSSGSLCGTLGLSDSPRVSDPLHDEARAKPEFPHLCPPWWHQAGCLRQVVKVPWCKGQDLGKLGVTLGGLKPGQGSRPQPAYGSLRSLSWTGPWGSWHRAPSRGGFGSPVRPAPPGFPEPLTPQQCCPGGRGMGTVPGGLPARQSLCSAPRATQAASKDESSWRRQGRCPRLRASGPAPRSRRWGRAQQDEPGDRQGRSVARDSFGGCWALGDSSLQRACPRGRQASPHQGASSPCWPMGVGPSVTKEDVTGAVRCVGLGLHGTSLTAA